MGEAVPGRSVGRVGLPSLLAMSAGVLLLQLAVRVFELPASADLGLLTLPAVVQHRRAQADDAGDQHAAERAGKSEPGHSGAGRSSRSGQAQYPNGCHQRPSRLRPDRTHLAPRIAADDRYVHPPRFKSDPLPLLLGDLLSSGCRLAVQLHSGRHIKIRSEV